MTKPSDHGDRSGGLLIGYIGLITVPVALEKIYWSNELRANAYGEKNRKKKSACCGIHFETAAWCGGSFFCTQTDLSRGNTEGFIRLECSIL